MTNDELIQTLVADMRPVQRIGSAATRARIWFVVASLGVGAGMLLLGVRADWQAKLHDWRFLRESAALLLASGLAAWSGLCLVSPGVRETRVVEGLAIVALLSWVMFVALRFSSDPQALHPLGGSVCVWRMLGLSVVPAIVLFAMLRRGAALARGSTALFACLACGALAMVGTQLLCARDDASHVLVWHCVPVIGAALFGAMLSKRILD